MNLNQACVLAAFISLAPLALYLFGWFKDPFNPLLIVSGVTFGTCILELWHNPDPALSFAPEYALIQYEQVVTLSLLALYAGWWAWRLRHVKPKHPRFSSPQALALYRQQYSPRYLILVGWAMVLVAATAWFILGDRSAVTGYLTWLTNLRFPGAILAIQAAILERRYYFSTTICVILACIPSLLFFFSYGGRGDTAQVLVLLCVPYLLLQRRPLKLYILIYGALFAIVLGTLAETRAMPNSTTVSGRISGIFHAGENLLKGKKVDYDSGREFIVGADQIAVLDKLHNYDDGRFLWNIVILALPKELFPNKYDYYSPWYASNYLQIIRDNLGVPTPIGAAPTGFANILVEFGWLFPLVWFALGYWLRSLHSGAMYAARLDLQGCLVILIIALLYLIAQDVYAYLRELIFNLIPLYLVYKLCRVRSVRTVLSPAMGNVSPVGTKNLSQNVLR
jgi:hypothetical protein